MDGQASHRTSSATVINFVVAAATEHANFMVDVEAAAAAASPAHQCVKDASIWPACRRRRRPRHALDWRPSCALFLTGDGSEYAVTEWAI